MPHLIHELPSVVVHVCLLSIGKMIGWEETLANLSIARRSMTDQASYFVQPAPLKPSKYIASIDTHPGPLKVLKHRELGLRNVDVPKCR